MVGKDGVYRYDLAWEKISNKIIVTNIYFQGVSAMNRIIFFQGGYDNIRKLLEFNGTFQAIYMIGLPLMNK